MRQQLANIYGQGEINPAIKALASAIESRVIILLSEMANNKVNESFLRKLSEGDDHLKLQENIIKPCLVQFQQLPLFDYQGDLPFNKLYYQSVQSANNGRCLSVSDTCQAYLTVRYYLRLLQDEYQRDINAILAVVLTLDPGAAALLTKIQAAVDAGAQVALAVGVH